MLYVQTDAVRTMRRAQWFLISLPILGGNGLVVRRIVFGTFVQRKVRVVEVGLLEA